MGEKLHPAVARVWIIGGALHGGAKRPVEDRPGRAVVRALGDLRPAEATTLNDDDVDACNTENDTDRVVPRPLTDLTVEDGTLRAVLPPVSWNVIRLSRPNPAQE